MENRNLSPDIGADIWPDIFQNGGYAGKKKKKKDLFWRFQLPDS